MQHKLAIMRDVDTGHKRELVLRTAVIASVVWGMSVITVLSYFLAKSAQERPLPIILEHLGIAMLVVLLSHLIGAWVGANFG